MSKKSNLVTKLNKLNLAVSRLEVALKEPTTNVLAIDGTIQRFEFTFELLWKTTKDALFIDGIDETLPREIIKRAYAGKYIHDESLWLQMLDDRNETSHTYNDESASKIYANIKSYFPEIVRLTKYLNEKSKNIS